MIGLDRFQTIDGEVLLAAILACNARDIVDGQDVIALLMGIPRTRWTQVGVSAKVALLAHQSLPLSNGVLNLGSIGM